jgi:hypothetical protein
MPRARDFWLASVQATIFSQEQTPVSMPIAMGSVLGEFAQRYSAPPEAMSFPGMPAEFPRATLKSEPDAWVINIFANRIDSVWRRQLNSDPVADETDLFTNLIAPLLSVITAAPNMRVGRLALMANRACAVNEPAKYLIDRFCSEPLRDERNSAAPFRNSVGFEIHNHKKFDVAEGIAVNSWVRCKTGQSLVDNSSAIVSEQDINTLIENTNNTSFSVEQVQNFYNASQTEMMRILEKYFPD